VTIALPRSAGHAADRVIAEVDAAAEEIVGFTSAMIRVPTVNPPGEAYRDCAELIAAELERCRFDVHLLPAEGRPEHTAAHPRVNVVGRRTGRHDRPRVHLNGHLDVVPAGAGWTVDPFGGVVREGRIYGRGACDMKAGIAAALYAAEAIRRSGVELNGSIDLSATVDEESGGFAGVAWLAESGRLTRANTDHVIIPEPLYVDRICIGHRGVYWFEITTHGRIAHGSMPFHGVNAIDHMGVILDRMQREILPALAQRTTAMPVQPIEARHPTLNVNGVRGGQPVDGIQTPCVADSCRAVFDRRFLIEEGFEATREEIASLLERLSTEIPALRYDLRDLMVVHPVQTPEGSPLVAALDRSLHRVLGRSGGLIASPGTYDHKHVTRIGGIADCVAYGPGILDLAHQPDEWCGVDDLVNATKVIALTLLDLTQSG
jgi:succinyl-diaminopimelate desuccinylase